MKTGFIILLITLVFGQLSAFVPTPGVVIYLHDIVLVALLCVGFVRKKPWRKPALFWPIVSFIVIGLVSLQINFTRFTPWQIGQGSLYLVRWIAYALLYVLIVQQSGLRIFLLSGLYVTGSVFSFLGLIQFALYPSLRNLSYLGWDPHYFRLFSTFLDPNYAGIFITLTIFLGLSIHHQVKSDTSRMHEHGRYDISFREVLWWVALVVNATALYLTYSRGGYLAFVVGFAVWTLIQKKKLFSWLFICFIAAIVIIPRPGGETLRLDRMDSTIARLENWQEAVSFFQKSPIIGHGFNTVRFLPRLNEMVKPGDPVSHAAAGVDNSFLFLLVTSGVAGLGVYLWLLWTSVRKSAPIGVVLVVALVVHALFVNSLFYPWIMLWFWMYWGAVESQ